MKKRILLINDLPGYGKVATAAMLPILSYMGYPVYNLPTMLISNTFEYGTYERVETTDYICGVLPVWQRLGFRFDAIATGFLMSGRQAEIVADYCREQAQQGVLVFVDPIMGDEGRLYSGSTTETVVLMRQMVAVAHLCYPNYTEACLLTDTPYCPQGTSWAGAKALLDALRSIGTRSALITSIVVDGRTAVVGYNHFTGEHFLLPYEEIPVHFPGTGDMFSAILIGHLLAGVPLRQSTRKAMDALYRLIDANRNNTDKNLGIPVECCLNLI